MPSSGTGKLQYLKDRSTNALLLLRQGRFRVFVDMFKMEADLQLSVLRQRIGHRVNSHSKLDSEYIDRRKLRPPSYKPTAIKPAADITMQADPEEVKAELSKILSSFKVKERG